MEGMEEKRIKWKVDIIEIKRIEKEEIGESKELKKVIEGEFVKREEIGGVEKEDMRILIGKMEGIELIVEEKDMWKRIKNMCGNGGWEKDRKEKLKKGSKNGEKWLWKKERIGEKRIWRIKISV